ncbi:hypothetical protein GE21DRAFT_1313435 [Neurospora crassa]|nr:hypothetical protein GE21DRAFT_1313435 [Neurospora crassa]
MNSTKATLPRLRVTRPRNHDDDVSGQGQAIKDFIVANIKILNGNTFPSRTARRLDGQASEKRRWQWQDEPVRMRFQIRPLKSRNGMDTGDRVTARIRVLGLCAKRSSGWPELVAATHHHSRWCKSQA